MKQDLNLLPRKEKSAAYGLILPVLLGLLLFAAVLYAAITIPNGHLATLRQQHGQILNDRVLYANVSAEFQRQNAQLQDLLGKKAAIDETFDTSHAPSRLMAALETACPVTVKLTSLSVNESGLVVVGVAPQDRDIAQYMVNLRNSGLFGRTNISYVSPIEYTEIPLREGEIQPRSFSLILNYPDAQATDTQGGSAK